MGEQQALNEEAPSAAKSAAHGEGTSVPSSALNKASLPTTTPDEDESSLFEDRERARKGLAPSGILRVGLNLANKLLTSSIASQTDSCTQAEGVAPELAEELANELGVPVQFVPYPSPKALAEDSTSEKWDIAFLGKDPSRATSLAFSLPYADIPCAFLVKKELAEEDSTTASAVQLEKVDKPGFKIASFRGACYDLWLQRNLKHAQLIQADSFDMSVLLFEDGRADCVAGVVGQLLSKESSDFKLLPGPAFMTVPQAIAVPVQKTKDLSRIIRFLDTFVAKRLDEASRTGDEQEATCSSTTIVDLLKRHKVHIRLLPHEQKQLDRLRITVLGCGAMGSIYAALLASAGNIVTAVDVWKDHVTAMREKGLKVEGASGGRTILLSQVSTDASDIVGGTQDLVIIATKAAQVPAAVKAGARLLRTDDPKACMLLIQNGIGTTEEGICEILGPSGPRKILLGIASNFGACMKGPGQAEHKSMNLIVMGEMAKPDEETQTTATDPLLSARVQRVQQAWSDAGFTTKGSADIHADIWEKLICNCANSAVSAVLGFTVGQILDCPEARNLSLTCAKEAAKVATAKGIKLKCGNSDAEIEAHVLKFGSTVRQAQPSMLQDHLAKRKCEIGAINGAIPLEAAKVGLEAPTNKILADIIVARESAF
ncbi:unnamed protein product [Amoebophrya sp. A120]|nr:unnamed protein product [Amoebophrya sp. A120]|eukprot:GSA120T00017818001.1